MRPRGDGQVYAATTHAPAPDVHIARPVHIARTAHMWPCTCVPARGPARVALYTWPCTWLCMCGPARGCACVALHVAVHVWPCTWLCTCGPVGGPARGPVRAALHVAMDVALYAAMDGSHSARETKLTRDVHVVYHVVYTRARALHNVNTYIHFVLTSHSRCDVCAVATQGAFF